MPRPLFVAEIQSTKQVALEARNSPAMIFKHYRELVPAEAAKWFAVKPESVKELKPAAVPRLRVLPTAAVA